MIRIIMVSPYVRKNTQQPYIYMDIIYIQWVLYIYIYIYVYIPLQDPFNLPTLCLSSPEKGDVRAFSSGLASGHGAFSGA